MHSLLNYLRVCKQWFCSHTPDFMSPSGICSGAYFVLLCSEHILPDEETEPSFLSHPSKRWPLRLPSAPSLPTRAPSPPLACHPHQRCSAKTLASVWSSPLPDTVAGFIFTLAVTAGNPCYHPGIT